jgi:hypothetical protein
MGPRTVAESQVLHTRHADVTQVVDVGVSRREDHVVLGQRLAKPRRGMHRIPRIVGQKVQPSNAHPSDRRERGCGQRGESSGQHDVGTPRRYHVDRMRAEGRETRGATPAHPPRQLAAKPRATIRVARVADRGVDAQLHRGFQQMRSDMCRRRIADDEQPRRHAVARFPIAAR